MIKNLSKIYKKFRKLQGEILVKFLGWSVFSEVRKFDIIFLLDGCRYDTFSKINFLPGRLEKRISLGSCTPEWAKKSFPKKPLENLVYLSANPFVSSYYLEKWKRAGVFGRLEALWDYAWDESLNTVPPEAVVRAFVKFLEEEKDKKFFVHFMQPHHPFIGRTRIKESGWKVSRETVKNGRKGEEGANIYALVEKGIISTHLFKKAYEDNLRLVLEEVDKIRPKLKGKRVLITSDHGELLGEYGMFGHPEGLYLPELIEVPYFVLES